MLGIRSTAITQRHGRITASASSIISQSLATTANVRPISILSSLTCCHHHHQPNLILSSASLISKPRISCRVFETRRFQSDKAPGNSSSSGDKSSSTTADSSTTDAHKADGTNNEIILTPGEKVVVGTRVTIWAAALVFASACAYYIGRELFPSKMSPNSVFNSSFELIRNHPDVTKRFGAPLKAYGRDHGGHREGRRNFVEHTEYTDKDDGTKRTRVRYNLEGQAGDAFVFAEVSNDLPSGEFVYILVQDKRNGYVTTVVDNRSAMMTKRLAAGNKEGEAALATLLGGRK